MLYELTKIVIFHLFIEENVCFFISSVIPTLYKYVKEMNNKLDYENTPTFCRL